MRIYCCGCKKTVNARRATGADVYPHRPDLHALPFWQCTTCRNYVGTHHRSTEPEKPLGCIPTPEIREARRRIHAILDPMWKSGGFRRGEVYSTLSQRLGYQYHSAEIRSVDEANRVVSAIKAIAEGRTL